MNSRRPSAFLICAEDYAPHSVGGAEQQARLQAEELVRRGHTVSVVCPRFDDSRSGVLNGVQVLRLPFAAARPFGLATYLVSLCAWLMAHVRRFDCIFVHRASPQADLVVLVARLLRCPVWVRLAASGSGDIWRMRRVAVVTRYVGIRSATWVQAISEPIAAEVSALGVPSDRILRIPNGVDTDRFQPPRPGEKERLRAKLHLPSSPTRIVVFVGRFSRQKGLHDLIEVWSATEKTDAVLVVIGSAAVRDPVPIPESIPGLVVRPWVPDIETYYRAGDIFVLPSHVEGMSNALLEAMACGLPSVVTRIGANHELVSEGESGLLIDPGDRASLQRCLHRLISDPGLCQLMGARAHSTVRSRFAVGAVVDKMLEVVDSHAAGRPRKARA